MDYDLAIVGAGPAGLTAGIYAARYRLNAIILGKEIGGYAATAHKICNFPSYKEISGLELIQKIIKQVQELKIPIIYEEVNKIEQSKEGFVVSANKKKYNAKKVIYAGGTIRVKLNIPDENKFTGKGISYCATCDAGFFKNKTVAVIGGSDAALTSALLLKEYANKVYIIYKGDKFLKAEPTWVELVNKEKKIEIMFKDEILEVKGKDKVEGIKLKSGKTLDVDGVFVEIGSVPDINFILSLKVKKDNKGYIITDKEQRTNIKGLFAAGDITNGILKQIVSAAAEGAIAAYSAYKEIKVMG